MRFIDVTRYGGVKTLRLSVAAIAYVDSCEGGAVVRLIGGESLRVNEDCATVEARAIEADGWEIPPTIEEFTPATVIPGDGSTSAAVMPKAKARKGKRK